MTTFAILLFMTIVAVAACAFWWVFNRTPYDSNDSEEPRDWKEKGQVTNPLANDLRVLRALKRQVDCILHGLETGAIETRPVEGDPRPEIELGPFRITPRFGLNFDDID